MNRVVLLLCCLLGFNTPTIAKLTAGFDYREGILDAELVCIVSQKTPDVFKVDEVFLATGQRSNPFGCRAFNSSPNNNTDRTSLCPSLPIQEFCCICATKKTRRYPERFWATASRFSGYRTHNRRRSFEVSPRKASI
jgi:hypothetical protein